MNMRKEDAITDNANEPKEVQKKNTSSRKRKRKAKKSSSSRSSKAKYPRHSLEKALRIPAAILEQNAGKPCSDSEAARFSSIRSGGAFRLEASSGIKFGLLDRPEPKKVAITELSKKILRPQSEKDELEGLRQAVLTAPEISDVYKHYRGENLPDLKFLNNALVETFKIPQDKVEEFKVILIETLKKAQLIEEHNGKQRVIDFSMDGETAVQTDERLRKLAKNVKIASGDTCFVVMPFAKPHGDYYSQIYKPAIEKANLKSVRADSEIFGSGKVMNQIWSGINSARVLVAELTTKNANVFYELGLAHALKKPVVLVSANEEDVPFDLHHIRVIYYDVTDPFWGNKLIEKVAENITSALNNPEEAIFEGKIPD
jgi:hypothetical protein